MHELFIFTAPLFVGFITAITGIAVISFNGTFILKINPAGDILALSGAVLWALYSVFVSKSIRPVIRTLLLPGEFFYCIIFILLLSAFSC